MLEKREFIKGILAGIFCFTFWGIAPIFWKLFNNVSAAELLLHRILWGFLTLVIIITFKGKIGNFFKEIRTKKRILLLSLSAIFISTNWFIFTYAVTHNHIVEASLGYFMNPLMNVFLGKVFLGENLSKRKWFALMMAFLGVMVMFYGKVEGIEIALILAITFAIYGLIRKQLSISSEFGLLFELALASLPALYFFTISNTQTYRFYEASTNYKLLFVCCGLVTITPLFYFVYAAKRLEYSQIGILQYIAPFLQLIVGTSVYGEAFTNSHLISFVLIWSAIIIFMSKEIKTVLIPNRVKKHV